MADYYAVLAPNYDEDIEKLTLGGRGIVAESYAVTDYQVSP